MLQLDPEQLQAVTAPRGPVCIIAGAGTGKTRTITHRIAHLVEGGFVNPDHVLAVTFTKRAASELRERLTLMNVPKVQAKTFHSATMRQLQYFWPAYAGDVQWRLENSTYRLVHAAARKVGVEPSTETVKDLNEEISWAKSSLIVPEDYPRHVVPQRRDCPVEPERFVKVFRAYEQFKVTDQGIICDFNDLLLHMTGAIESHPGIAQEFRERYRTFVVDEYQDVTPLQQRLLDAWLGDRDDLTVVGDANQTIYSFNGASPEFLLDFSRKYPEATVVRLHRDYRSTPNVVGLANRVIEKASGRAAGTRLELEGQRPPGPDPEFTEYTDDAAEAEGVAQRIQALISKGVDPGSIAVLYRVNDQSAALEYALDQAGIGYEVKGGEGFFQRTEIKEAMRALTRAAQRFQPEYHDILPAVQHALQPLGLGTQEPSGAQERRRWNSLNALYLLVRDIIQESTTELSFATVVSMLRERAESKNPPKVQGVTLSSIHTAKGLEWDAVFLIGLVEGMLPIRYALKGKKSEEAIEEERRLFYVGVTRAREHLYLSWASARAAGGKANRRRTRFLDGLVPGEQSESGERSARGRSAHGTKGAPKNACTVCGTRLATPEFKILGRCGEHVSELDHVLVTELRHWRTSVASDRGVPAYVVFTDATLKAIAQTLPSTREELVGVPGIGPVKVEEFGDDVLAIVDNFS
ncbi:ATP-dependent DNA helicase UvrD2 [Corynebacterium sp. 320]|uniref:ATP-dependent DNA helicase UvrD2 n=1 Tax=Corynebacterium TaxID=1716 RepID=UPI00125CB853|nr:MULTISPECIES: ATP-dependent DNA helicase UvrD2 [Corynebacterium]KAB1504146.1 ATP-dependent DNA helicase UvrD2 [Corynebacterium sp. 320]KAB1552754.1 ATP-dependent DNA helicase UvrD2 [Corynebacterium sp. 321]KAB1554028.1 ATP-dependent DNA helicase UvrD2 [Corynebacterium sp. 319]KAB3528282.1 ATP-dependent DNA helicase UvrD2 [Corynebacterium sp. 250]KAB3540229.1 ATP-dependent DNA helicase UvrD2 [Corynebacterium sp. 366]